MTTALLAALLLWPSSARAAVEEVSVVVSGEVRAPLSAYRVGETYYLSAREAGARYGAQVYWYPVSGRVQMSVRGRILQFLVNSDVARHGDGQIKLAAPVMVRASQAYIPMSFFLSREFSDWAGLDTTFDPRTRLLTADRRGTVGPLRWVSYDDHTRITVEIKDKLVAKTSARGVRGLQVSIPLGVVEGSEQADIDDGMVASYSLRQGPKGALLAVKFARTGVRWRVAVLAKPRRLAMDFFVREFAPVREPSEAGGAAPAPPPAAAKAAAETPASPVAPQPAAARRHRIVIDLRLCAKDAGGPARRGTREKDITLTAAEELARLLREEGTFDVLLTRDGDTFVPLSDRSRRANEFGADVFVSLHCNAAPSARETGFEVYFLSEKASDPEAERLAAYENSVLALEGKSVQEENAALLLQELSKTENINAASELAGLVARRLAKSVSLDNRGVKQAAFYVLRGTHAPAILVEMAYISNKKDEAKLESRRFRRKLLDGLYGGIVDFAKRQGWMGAAR
jgi:N-acetylmuramoyl-L-alanine amidase